MAELMRHLSVDSYGRFMRNKRLWWDRGTVSKRKTLRRYAYALAFENSISPDYVTEKFFEPLLTGAIPVYLGAPNIEEFAPGRNCHINVADFRDPARLADYLKSVDPTEFHRWREEPLVPAFQQKLEGIAADSGHRLGELVQTAKAVREARSRGCMKDGG